MSLGATDRKWWDLLMRWLGENNDRQLVLFEYDDQYSPTTPYGWLEKEDIIMDKLTSYNSHKGLIVENMRSRIHIAVHKNIFQMKKIKIVFFIKRSLPIKLLLSGQNSPLRPKALPLKHRRLRHLLMCCG